MKFTFGIITGGGADDRISQVIQSIKEENIPDFEIIVVGGCNIKDDNLKVIPFDESIKQRWITKKKNLITYNSTYENIVFMHDYIKLLPGWYQGFLNFGNSFDLCMTRMENMDGSRYRDWTLWAEDNPNADRNLLLPYTETSLSKLMYFSGAYWIAKKQVMLNFPLDENLCWGNGEDVEWSKIVREHYSFSMNVHSTVQLLVYHGPIFSYATTEYIKVARQRLGIYE